MDGLAKAAWHADRTIPLKNYFYTSTGEIAAVVPVEQ
jgi:hypothetical protein